MSPRCIICTEGASFDQKLFQCIACKKRYHSKCHRPHPQEKSRHNWTCQRCLMRPKDRDKRRYNDNASVSSHSSTSRALSSVLSSRHTSPAMSATSNSMSSFTTVSGESDPPKLITCGYPGCIEKTLSSQFLCHAHQLEAGLFGPPAPESSTPVQDLRSSSVNENGHPSAGIGRALPSGVKATKLLLENDKDRPILRRKTAPTALRDPFMPRQPSSRQTTVSISDDSTVSPTSPKPVLARPPVHSPYGSPDNSRDSEPTRKRQKTSHLPNGHLESRLNGAQAIALDRGDFGVKHKLAKVQPHRPSYSSTVQRSGRGPETEKNGFRLSSQHRPSPVRKMAPQNLRHIPGLGSPVRGEVQPPSKEFSQSPAPVNESALHGPNLSHQVTQNPTFRHKDLHNLTGTFNQPSMSHNSKQATMLNGHAEQGLANNGANEQLTSGAQSLFNQTTGPSSHTERTEAHISRSQPQVVPISRMHKLQSQQTMSAGMIAPGVRQVNHVQPLIKAPPKLIDETLFDALIYQQEGASTPPPEVLIPEPETPAPDPDPPDEPIYADVDPRIHWTLPQSDLWLEKKLEEIEVRGGRKANFGKAANSLKKQRLEEQSLTFEETLPDKIADDPAWVRALRKLESDAREASAPQGTNGTTKRKPGPKRQISNGSGSSSVRGNIPELQPATRVG